MEGERHWVLRTSKTKNLNLKKFGWWVGGGGGGGLGGWGGGGGGGVWWGGCICGGVGAVIMVRTIKNYKQTQQQIDQNVRGGSGFAQGPQKNRFKGRSHMLA